MNLSDYRVNYSMNDECYYVWHDKPCEWEKNLEDQSYPTLDDILRTALNHSATCRL